MSITKITDIAKYCDVSVSTVSRVINNHKDVSAATRERVLKAVEDLHYIPNDSARSLVRTSTDTIALVVKGIANPFFYRLIKVVEAEIYRKGYTLLLHQIHNDGDEMRTAAALFNEKKVCGILFLGGRFNYGPQEAGMLRVPWVCSTYTNAFGSLKPEDYSSVSIDDRKEAQRAVLHLIQLGHRRIASLISKRDEQGLGRLRYEGYLSALRRAGLTCGPELVAETGSYEIPQAYEAAMRLLKGERSFTAIFAMTDLMAMGAMKALSDFGLSAPKDCSVIGIDGLETGDYMIPTLTTMAQPADLIAYESIILLIDLIEGRGENRHVILDAVLRQGGSCGPPGKLP